MYLPVIIPCTGDRVPESRFILSHFLSDDSPKQTYVACIARFPASTRQTRRTPDGRPSYLLSRDRYPIPGIETPRLCQAEALIT